MASKEKAKAGWPPSVFRGRSSWEFQTLDTLGVSDLHKGSVWTLPLFASEASKRLLAPAKREPRAPLRMFGGDV